MAVSFSSSALDSISVFALRWAWLRCLTEELSAYRWSMVVLELLLKRFCCVKNNDNMFFMCESSHASNFLKRVDACFNIFNIVLMRYQCTFCRCVSLR